MWPIARPKYTALVRDKSTDKPKAQQRGIDSLRSCNHVPREFAVRGRTLKIKAQPHDNRRERLHEINHIALTRFKAHRLLPVSKWKRVLVAEAGNKFGTGTFE